MTGRPSKGLTTALMTLGVALLLAGCGGGGDGTSANALTKAQFLKKANAICVRGTKEWGIRDRAFWRKHTFPVPEPALARGTREIVMPVRKKELRLIRALGLPREGTHYVEVMLSAWEEGIEKGEEDARSLRAGGPKYAFYKSYSMGIDYGLEKCWLG
jgi:hypothetical protein